MKIKDKDIELWEKWKRSRSSQDLSNLLNQMGGVIRNETFKYMGNLPMHVVEAQAKIEAIKAFDTFDPDRNVKLSTHLTNYLRKLNRMAYKYQEIYNVPEARRIKYHTFNVVKSKLEDKYGRDPTVEEMAHALKWSRAEVNRFFQEQRTELSDSQPLSNDISLHQDPNMATLAYVYHDLAPREKLLMEHTTGFTGKPVLSNPQLMRKLNMTQGQLSYAKRNLITKIDQAMK